LFSVSSDTPVFSAIADSVSPDLTVYVFFFFFDEDDDFFLLVLVAVAVAVMETILRLAFRDVHSLYHALFLVGPVTNLIEIVTDGRRGGQVGVEGRVFLAHS